MNSKRMQSKCGIAVIRYKGDKHECLVFKILIELLNIMRMQIKLRCSINELIGVIFSLEV